MADSCLLAVSADPIGYSPKIREMSCGSNSNETVQELLLLGYERSLRSKLGDIVLNVILVPGDKSKRLLVRYWLTHFGGLTAHK